MSAGLVDEIEFLGTLVDAGEITQAEAAHCLQDQAVFEKTLDALRRLS